MSEVGQQTRDEEINRLRNAALQTSNSILTLQQHAERELLAAKKALEDRTEELANLVSLLNATLESTADGIVAIDLMGRVISYNSKFAAMWRLPAALLEQRDISAIMSHAASQAENSHSLTRRIEELLANPETEAFDVVELRDGRTFERYAFPQWVNQKCVGIVLNWREVTERQRAEAEREVLLARAQFARAEAEVANRAKDEFLATLSHELRTPMTAILGWARLLGDGTLTREQMLPAIEAIQRNADLQAQLIEDVLDVSRIISGKLRLDVRAIELPPVIEAAIESVLPAALARDIRLQRVLDTGPGYVSGDPNRLQQVMWNLLSNAIKFTPKGGRVHVRLERVRSHVEIIVTDTGEGIEPEVLPYIFDRFRQADSTTTRNYGGLGLGLAIVRHLVEMHGGTIEAQSGGEGKGATFTVMLPLLAARSQEAISEQIEERIHPTAHSNAELDCPPELSGLHVLVVDDDEDARNLIKAVLEKCDARVTAVTSAAQALTALQDLRPDVLISDLGMPVKDGYALIGEVRALPPERGGETPAAALTAYARVEDRMRVLRSGFQIHLPKPVEPAELVTVVANLARRFNH